MIMLLAVALGLVLLASIVNTICGVVFDPYGQLIPFLPRHIPFPYLRMLLIEIGRNVYGGLAARLRRLPDWAWLLGIAALLRLPTIALENLWYDEGFTALIARLPIGQAWTAIQGDVHPPFWYALEWVMVHLLGDSELVLRLPAALFGILSVWLLWRIALVLGFDRRTAFLAGLLGALLPGTLYYSQEARMYTALLFFVLLMLNAALREGWIVFAIGGIGAVYSQHTGLIYVAALGLTILAVRVYRRQYRQALYCLAACLAIAAAWLPWFLFGMLRQFQQVGAGFWLPPITPGLLFFPPIFLGPGTRVSEWWQALVYIPFLGLMAFGLIRSRRWLSSGQGALVVAVVITAPATLVLVSLLWRDIFLHRALIPSVALLCLPMAHGLAHLSSPNRRAAWSVFGPALLIALLSFYFPAGRARGPIATWLKQIQYQPGDVVYHLAVDTLILTEYYAPYPDALFPESNDLSQSLTDQTKNAMGFRQVPFDDLAGMGYKRAWLITSIGPLISARELAESQRLLAAYHPQLIDALGDDYAKSWIYLVTLP